MWNCMVYLKSGYRRPVRLRPCLPGEDAQGAIPMGWCCRCGGEVFGAGELCLASCQCLTAVEKLCAEVVDLTVE